MVIFCYGLKKRVSRRGTSSSHQQNSPDPEDHPSSFIAPPELTDEEFQRSVAPPPSYEEAARSSQSNINSTSPSLESNGEGSTDIQAYDSSGLPSYNEALRISQISLNRA